MPGAVGVRCRRCMSAYADGMAHDAERGSCPASTLVVPSLWTTTERTMWISAQPAGTATTGLGHRAHHRAAAVPHARTLPARHRERQRR
jgi:hypothetical protein